jgi:squalene-hopene/tetraprenyl-beta-curcumene cyclase
MNRFAICAVGVLAAALSIHAAEPAPLPVQPMLQSASTFLLDRQADDGSWARHPALTGLCIMAVHDVAGVEPEKRDAAIDKGMAYMLSFIQNDGAIYPADRDRKESANYPNYTTSIALLTMAVLNRPQDIDAMRAARRYLQASQFDDPDAVDFGGIGYGRTGRADLSNGAWAAEALYATDYLDSEPFNNDQAAAAHVKKMWRDLAVFLEKCQNLPKVNKQSYTSHDKRDRGGFIYRPFESKAGDRSSGSDNGAQSQLISSGSMTYAALKTMIYARLGPNDARVRGAIDYLQRNYTLKKNPGMGQQGLYYYLHTMTKALDAYGAETFTDAEGNDHHWRHEIAAELSALQLENGSWVNANGRFWESVPELATAYNMIALKVITGQINLKK